ncbi:uncharacterized protein V6R79_000590 [Siganus canaliculatus]
MSDQDALTSEEVTLSPAGQTAEPQKTGKKPEESNSAVEKGEATDEEEEEEEEEKREDEEVSSSAYLEPSTLPWPGDKDKWPQTDTHDGVRSEVVLKAEEKDPGTSQDLYEVQSQTESDRKRKSKWRESMPEGDRWRDEEIEVQRHSKGDGSLADDEDEGEEEEEEDETDWTATKAALGFMPQVTIVRPSSKALPEELFVEKDEDKEPQEEPDSVVQVYPEYAEEDDKYYICGDLCSERLKIALSLLAGGVLFPLLVWGGYALLPFDPPTLKSAPLRVVYTLRCSFFAVIPVVLGMLVLGVARLRFSTMKPLYKDEQVNSEVAAHWHYVNESLGLFLFFFLQLAVMATYISQDLVKLVPLLTIVFVFGRLIYWLCLCLSSSVRGLGFGLSYFPILVMLGTNLYYVCSSVGVDSVFDVAPPPTEAPPPKLRWWW